MPRYLVERSFPDGFETPPGPEGREALISIIKCNFDRNVNWVHSYVSIERDKTFCVYDAPTPKRCVEPPAATASRSTASQRSRCWTHIPITPPRRRWGRGKPI
ncbi:MAG: nickel-binding protein [Acidimicrobiia bacterium]